MDARTNRTNTRRHVVLSALAAAGVLGAAPSGWRRPVVQSMLLPAHATTSGTGGSASSGQVVFASIGGSSENRIPSGSSAPVESLATLVIQGCSDLPGQSVFVSGVANMLPSGVVSLGSSGTTTDSVGSFSVTFTVPASIAAAIAQIASVDIALSVGSITPPPINVTQSALVASFTTPGTFSCPL